MLDLLKYTIKGDDQSDQAMKSVRANLGDVKGALASVEERAKRTGKAMRNIGLGMTAGVTAPLALLGKQSVALFDQQLEAQKTVEQVVASTGGAAGLASEKLFKMASGLQEISTYGDEDILRNLTAPLLTFTKIQGDTFERAQAATLDMATLLKMDMRSAAVQVGKALNDPILGVTALGRAGVQFTEEQKKVIKSLVETGDAAAAQALILSELETQFQGQAAAAAKTPLGQWQNLSNAIGDVKEELGAQIVPFLIPLREDLKSVIKWFADLSPEVKKNIVVFGGLAAAAGPVLAALGLVTIGVSGLIGPVAALTALVAANPLGALAIGASAAAAWLLTTKDSADQAETSLYDAAAGSAALNAALGVFYDTAAPSAGKSAIDLANDNYKLAESALYAAEAEVAKQKALLATSEAEAKSGSNRRERNVLRPQVDAAMADLARAQAAIDQARADRQRAANAITGSVYTLQNPKIIAPEAPEIVRDLKVEIDGLGGSATSAAKELSVVDQEVNDLAQRADQIDQVLANGFSISALRANGLAGAIANVAEELLNMAGNAVIMNIFDGLGLGDFFASIIPSANGNVFSGGDVVPFATGGIVSSPTFFPMSGSKTGLMGEAGPEAIMPLTRIGGKLGVQASGSQTVEVVLYAPEWMTAEQVDQRAGNIAVRIVSGALSQQHKTRNRSQHALNERGTPL